MESILISVIMANYKTKIEYLKEAIDSILNQTYSNLELIIIDDCSQDESVEYIQSINDIRVKLLINKKNCGPAITRNRGLKVAKGKYIAIMDSDDISLPTRLEKQMNYMERNPDVIVCGTWFEKFGIHNMVRKPIIDDFEFYRCQLLFSNTPLIMCHSSAMIRKSYLDKYQIFYDASLLKSQDYGLWVECSKYAKIVILNEVLVKYRTHFTQISTATTKEQLNYACLVSRRQLQGLEIDFCEEENRWRYSHIIDKADLLKFEFWLCKIKENNESKQIYNTLAMERYLDLMLNRAIQALNIFNRLSLYIHNSNIRAFYSRKFKEKTKRKKNDYKRRCSCV